MNQNYLFEPWRTLQEHSENAMDPKKLPPSNFKELIKCRKLEYLGHIMKNAKRYKLQQRILRG